MVSLAATAAQLRAEPHAPVAGHRQIAVFRHGPVTMLQFVFEAGGLLKEHQADGVVTIHALSGRLMVIADEQPHELGAGELVALAPAVMHSVRALEPSEMLLTVHRIPAESEERTA
jgi:quercetin dioxygenase-like cupin family protein